MDSCGSKKSKNKETPLFDQVSTTIQYDQFLGEERSFEDLVKRAEELKAHPEIAGEIIEEIKRRVKLDPAITCLTSSVAKSMRGIASNSNPPYDEYRAGREIEGAFFNGSDVHTDLQNFLLFGCPRGPKDTADFFDTVIQQKIRVIVSLNERGEPRKQIPQLLGKREAQNSPPARRLDTTKGRRTHP